MRLDDTGFFGGNSWRMARLLVTLGAVLAIVGFFAVFVLSGTAEAQSGGGVGDGGSGSGGGGGHQSSEGYGFVVYPSSNGDGPTADLLRNGTLWDTDVSPVCRDAGASEVVAFIVYNPAKDGKVYDAKNWWEEFTNGSSQDHGRAVGITNNEAQIRWNALSVMFPDLTADFTFRTVNGNVGWFCWNFTPPPVDLGTCSIVSAPATVEPGQSFSIRVRVNNTGTTTWHRSGAHPYRLGSQNPQDNTIWGAARATLPVDVGPGGSTDIIFTVTAPATTGLKSMTWRMLHEGVTWFPSSGNCSRAINVALPSLFWDYDLNTTPHPACITRRPGQTFDISTYVVNNGSGTGANYRHRIYGWSAYRPAIASNTTIIGGTAGTNNIYGGRTWSNMPALGAGRSITRYVRYRVNASATNNQYLYFMGDVAGAAGQSSPVLTTTDPIDTSRDGEGGIYTTCVRIVNDWNYNPTLVKEVNTGTTSPGRVVGMRPTNTNVGSTTGSNYNFHLQPSNAATWTYTSINTTGGSGGTANYGTTDVIAWRNRPGLGGGANFRPAGFSRYNVLNSTPNGTNLCFRVYVSPHFQGSSSWERSSEICWTVDRRTYDYNPATPTATSSLAQFYPGSSFRIRGRITNDGNGTGPTYWHGFEAIGPVSPVGVWPTSGNSGLAAGASRSHSTPSGTYTVNLGAANNANVRCRESVNPNTGLALPSPFTYNAPRDDVRENANCFRVYNQRYNITTLDDSFVEYRNNAGASTNTVLPGERFSVAVDTCNTESVNGAPYTGAVPGRARGIRTTITPSSGGNVIGSAYSTGSRTVNRGGSNCETDTTPTSGASQWRVDPNAALGDQVCVTVRINRDRGFSDGYLPIGNQTYERCASVAEQGFITVSNGSVWAGGGFDTSGSGYGTSWCDVPGGSDNGDILITRLNGVGAWADYLVGATDSIRYFGSSYEFASDIRDTQMTLTNTSSSNLGHFNSRGPCITDLESYLTDDTTRVGVQNISANVFPATGSDGQYIRRGNTRIGGEVIAEGSHITMLVLGDVTITDDITFANYSGTTKSDIPSFILFATGKIDIEGDVESLDGLYYSKGTIDTCSTGPNRLSNTVCDEQLVVTGAFMANDIEFRRTYGGVSGGNPPGRVPAEVFNFSSEAYLAEHYLVSDNEPELVIDRLVDLPPVIN